MSPQAPDPAKARWEAAGGSDGDVGVGLDSVAEVSRAVSAALDAHDPDGTALGGPYTLEVTSPGVDRPLTAPRHWRRARLRQVEVTPKVGELITGRVGDAGEDTVALLVKGKLREVRYADVQRADIQGAGGDSRLALN